MNIEFNKAEEIAVIFIPFEFKKFGGKTRIIKNNSDCLDEPMLNTIIKAKKWQARIDSGSVKSIKELAFKEGLDSSYLSKILRLNLLAPDIIESILNGEQPNKLSLKRARKHIPLVWQEQREYFGFC